MPSTIPTAPDGALRTMRTRTSAWGWAARHTDELGEAPLAHLADTWVAQASGWWRGCFSPTCVHLGRTQTARPMTECSSTTAIPSSFTQIQGTCKRHKGKRPAFPTPPTLSVRADPPRQSPGGQSHHRRGTPKLRRVGSPLTHADTEPGRAGRLPQPHGLSASVAWPVWPGSPACSGGHVLGWTPGMTSGAWQSNSTAGHSGWGFSACSDSCDLKGRERLPPTLSPTLSLCPTDRVSAGSRGTRLRNRPYGRLSPVLPLPTSPAGSPLRAQEGAG